MHTVEPLVSEHGSLEVDIATERLKMYKAPGIDQIPVELIEAGDNTLRSDIHKLINYTWNKEELPQQRNKSITVSISLKKR
jgi:hypothetical protein